MSDYTRTQNFTAKDSLDTGDPEKVITGADMDGELNAIATAIATKEDEGLIPSGTVMLFVQTAAPTGFTKSTTHNDKALRIVSGSVGTGGSVAFETAFASHTPAGSISTSVANTTATGTVGDTSLSVANLPSHTHLLFKSGNAVANSVTSSTAVASKSTLQDYEEYEIGNISGTADVGLSSATGSGSTHTHSYTGDAHNHTASSSFSGNAINLDVSYVDVIIATKD
jgi:hypothetical protein